MTSIEVSAHPNGSDPDRVLPTPAGAAVPGDLELVADLLDQASTLDPDVVDLHVSLARRLLERGCVRDARRHLRRALELDPLASETRCRLAAILVDEGEIPEALSLYRGGLAGCTSVRLQTEYADLLARLGFGEDASAAYRSAIADREDAPAVANLGIVHARRGEPELAAACFARAAALDPGCSEATLNLANAYVELGRLEEAEQIYLGLEDDEPLRGPARLGRSAIALARSDAVLARDLRRQAGFADRSLVDLCDTPGA